MRLKEGYAMERTWLRRITSPDILLPGLILILLIILIPIFVGYLHG